MFIGLDRDFVYIYNERCIALCGHKHPHALGQAMSQVRADVGDQLLPKRGDLVEFVNDADVSLFNSEGWTGKPIRAAYPEIEGQDHGHLLDQADSTGKRVVIHEAPLHYPPPRGAGAVLPHLDFIYAPFLDEAGLVMGVLCESNDVTDALTARKALRLQQEGLEQPAAALTSAN